MDKGQTIGLTSSGTFATSPLAAYPPEMCYFLAKCAFDDVVARDPGPYGVGILSMSMAPEVPQASTMTFSSICASARIFWTD